SFFDALESDGRQLLVEVETAIHQAHPELQVDVELQTADAVPALIEESDNARLIVLGSRGLGGFSGILIGSTAVALVAHGHCPVAVIRGTKPEESPPAHGPVVVGVDGSPTSESALAMAFDDIIAGRGPGCRAHLDRVLLRPLPAELARTFTRPGLAK